MVSSSFAVSSDHEARISAAESSLVFDCDGSALDGGLN